MDKKNNNKILMVVGSIVLLASIITGAVLTKSDTSEQTAVLPDSTDNTPTATSTTPSVATLFKDGTYSAKGEYQTPGGTENIYVTLSLAGDVVTNAVATAAAGNPESKRYQQIFITNFKQYVVGKNISTLNLTKVSGASLTPMGFNNAVAKIKTEAKA